MTDRTHADIRLLAESIHSLQREMNGGFEAIARALTALDRIESRLTAVVERQRVLDQRVDGHERRIAALEARRRATRTRTKKKPK